MELDNLKYYVHKALPRQEKIQANLLVFFLVEGTLTISCQEEKNRMSRGDILLCNPGTGYEISQCRDALLGEAVYPIPFLTRILGKDQMLLHCNSVKDMTHSYQQLRDILQQMTAEYAEGARSNRCREYAQLLRLLDVLTQDFQLGQGTATSLAEQNGQEEENDRRMRQIMVYIFSNLDKEISLNSLATDMYVSTSTLSRIFRKSTGVYFADYVTNLRVQMAMGLLESTEQNMTKIALGCGFMNSASFNRSFRKITGMTPSAYREKCRRAADQGTQSLRQLEEEQVRAELREKGYLANRQQTRSLMLDLEKVPKRRYRKTWDKVINIGPIWDLTNANVQYHTLYLSEQLHFGYIRVWNIFSKRMMLSDDRIRGAYNYNMVDQALDFLVAHQLVPFLDFGRRPDIAIGQDGAALFYEEQYIDFASRESWRNLVDDFLAHVIERYSQDVVSHWIFELSRDAMHGEELYNDPDFDYFDAFCYFYHCVRKRAPGAQFGGLGDLGPRNWNYLLRLLQRCKEHSVSPDFISLSLFNGEEEVFPAVPGHSQPSEIELDQILKLRQIMTNTGFADTRLYVTEWNNTVSNRNYLNDSCYRAAYFARKIAAFGTQADMIGIMGGTDWVSNYVDSVGVANGGIGLLTRDTIRKPAFYAISFLNRLGNWLLDAGEYYIATVDEKGDMYLLFFYYAWTRRDRYLGARDVDLRQYSNMGNTDEQPIRLTVTMDHLEQGGEYIIKREILNRGHGSILDEWGRFAYDLRLGRDDVKYLQSVSIPALTLRRESVDARKPGLKLELELEPDEISLVHIHCRK